MRLATVFSQKTNEPGSVQRHLAELLAAYPALGLLTGEAIFTQRPLLELLKTSGCAYSFQVKANQPDMLDALKTCFAEVRQARPAHETTEKRGAAAIPAGFGLTWRMPSISVSV